MFVPGSALLVVSARKTLNRLQRTHGAPAAEAAALFPGVSAAIDQHAAAIRDILDLGVENSALVPTSVLLAGYARGILEDLREAEAELPLSPLDWQDADWLHLRLAAVCSLSRAS
ncbi:DUF6401 family natural product biosynthesis protein [Nocardia seriolae]|uniref:Uncharacterized protein n=1 Tax=Nocardia seriolae TaxID=37332 RepID=A0A0B8NRM3_9NOCA|nr:DUF6401 family natural product biosynthesis protein [Nocardia seriolae]MTJ66055.1 hypothetical protein [Nocardia seriolae]MTJ76021.1 hypothetical protein [Nocardia seriolae]MTJ86025.1 hypothetical protein [Nocardia seriolae]MTK30021.1 hypothetical protein [Nocardia seriolae]MTK44053.1 hypothetical protein [Nocardia seriolae]